MVFCLLSNTEGKKVVVSAALVSSICLLLVKKRSWIKMNNGGTHHLYLITNGNKICAARAWFGAMLNIIQFIASPSRYENKTKHWKKCVFFSFVDLFEYSIMFRWTVSLYFRYLPQSKLGNISKMFCYQGLQNIFNKLCFLAVLLLNVPFYLSIFGHCSVNRFLCSKHEINHYINHKCQFQIFFLFKKMIE